MSPEIAKAIAEERQKLFESLSLSLRQLDIYGAILTEEDGEEDHHEVFKERDILKTIDSVFKTSKE